MRDSEDLALDQQNKIANIIEKKKPNEIKHMIKPRSENLERVTVIFFTSGTHSGWTISLTDVMLIFLQEHQKEKTKKPQCTRSSNAQHAREDRENSRNFNNGHEWL